MPGNGRAAAVSFSINGKGYVALGRDSLGVPLNDVWEFQPTTLTWIQKNTFSGISRVKAVAIVANGKAYVGLGFNSNKGVYTSSDAYLNDFWMYDSELDTWTIKDSLPSRATDACVSFEYKGDVYVGAGFNGYSFTNEFWKYSIENGTWTRLKDIPADSRAGAVLCKSDDRIFFGTGYRTLNENDWWEYFPETDTWIKRKSMSDNGRENGVSLSIKNHYFVATGKHFGGSLTRGYFFNDIKEYDAVRNIWYTRGKLPAPARENAIAFVIDGKGYIGFGDDDKQTYNDLWSFEADK